MAYESKYDPNRRADLRKQSARGKRIQARGDDIKKFRKSLPFTNDPINKLRYKQKEYTYSPHWRDVDREELRKRPGDDAKEGWLANLFGGLGRDTKQQVKDLTRSTRKSGLLGDVSTMAGDLTGLGSFNWPTFQLTEAITNNWEQDKENKRILGDDYTDELRKSMVPGWDLRPGDAGYEGSKRSSFDKYKNLWENAPTGNPGDRERKEEYKSIMDSAFRNAQITKRVNYALGDLGFDTSAEAGTHNVDYGTLGSRLKRGLEGTIPGRRFLEKHAILKDGDTDHIRRAITNFNKPIVEEEISIVPKPKPPYKLEGWDEQYLFPPSTIAEAYGEELPAYSDVPVSILEDYDAQDLGGPLRWRVGDAFHPIDTSGYPDRDLERDEFLKEQLADNLSLINSSHREWEEEQRLKEDLLGRGAGLENPFEDYRLKEDLLERGAGLGTYRSGMPYDDFPMINPDFPTYPDFYDFLGQTYGPGGMDAYWDKEAEERIRGLWGTQYYPDQLGPVDI